MIRNSLKFLLPILLISILDGYVFSSGLHAQDSRQDIIDKAIDNLRRQTGPSRKDEELSADLSSTPKTNKKLSESLSFGVYLELEYQMEKDFDLNKRRKDDVLTLDPKLSAALAYGPVETLKAFVHFEAARELVEDDRGKKKDRTKLELKQAFVSWDGFMEDLNIKAGRQLFRDSRAWLFDEELDGLRVFYLWPSLSWDFSATERHEIDLNSDLTRDNAVNYILRLKSAITPGHYISPFVFVQDDHTEADQDPVFWGAQMDGELGERIRYWLDGAYMGGSAANNDLRGYGIDGGWIYTFDVKLKPSIIGAFAYGSGDDTSDQVDRNFRQTGFQDNEMVLSGVTKVKYYGEVFDPELSNLSIYTAGVGIRPTKKSSVEIFYHRYVQNEPSTSIRNNELDKSPNGRENDIGDEIDLAAGWKVNRDVKVSMTWGSFSPGAAFSSSPDAAYFGEVKVRYIF